MSRWAKILILAIVVGGLSFMVYKIVQQLQQKKQARQERKELPPFTFYQLDSTKYTPEQLPSNRSTIVMYFKPDCGHCEDQWKIITDHYQSFSKSTLLLISPASSQALQDFQEEHSAHQYSNIHFLRDPDEQFEQLFGTPRSPNIFIYDSDGQLHKHFKGVTKAELLQNALDEIS